MYRARHSIYSALLLACLLIGLPSGVSAMESNSQKWRETEVKSVRAEQSLDLLDTDESSTFFDVSNVSNKVITALVLKHVGTDADGTASEITEVQDFVWIPDDDNSESDLVRRTGNLLPGQLYRTAQKISSPHSYRVTVDAVLFDDLSYEGNRRWVDYILREREVANLVYSRWLDEISSALGNTTDEKGTRTSLERILRRLSAGESFGNSRVSSGSDAAKVAQSNVRRVVSAVLESNVISGRLMTDGRAAISEYLESRSDHLLKHVTHSTAGIKLRDAKAVSK